MREFVEDLVNLIYIRIFCSFENLINGRIRRGFGEVRILSRYLYSNIVRFENLINGRIFEQELLKFL